MIYVFLIALKVRSVEHCLVVDNTHLVELENWGRRRNLSNHGAVLKKELDGMSGWRGKLVQLTKFDLVF